MGISPILFAVGDEKYDPTTLVFPSFLHTMGIRKATKTHLMIYTRNKVKVRDPQGLAVVRLKSWDDPNNKKDDDEVTGYGINSGENVIVYNKSMTSLGIYGVNEKRERALKNPTGVAANEIGDVYVADTGNHRIVRFFNPKKNLKFVRGIGGRGALPGQFESPQGVALDSHGMVYVSDTGNHRIQILRPDDVLHLWFGDQGVEDGELWHPTGIAVTDGGQKWSYYKDSFIALIDLDHTRVQKFTLDGKFMKATRLKDFGFSTGHLAYLAMDYYSNIWVTDTANHCIHKFDRNLDYLTSFGRKGTGDKEFMEPRGFAIYKRFGQVFVAENESAQY
ncbi:MAG: NHL repeat-containing protein, partial [bacterium]